MAQVRLWEVGCTFGKTMAIEDITFEICDRAFWVLVGPSGCGKSTILRTIAGLESVSRGELYIGDRLVNDIPARQRDVAMVFQNYALYPHFTVADNLAFGLKMRGNRTQDIALKVQEVARSLDIEHLLKRKPKQLSGGQQQRVALGRAIARQPQVFLLDEPLSNLDAQLRDGTRAELKRLHQQFGITTVYVTHDQTEAMTLADKIVVLSAGRIQQIGSPNEVYHQPANRMVAEFLGDPPMNILTATYEAGRLNLANNQFLQLNPSMQQRLQLNPGQKVDLGIRPEHLTIKPTSTQDSDDCLILEVDLVELLGRETNIKAVIPDSQIRINLVVDGSCQSKKGDLLTVKFDLDRLFLFDVDRGRAIESTNP